MHSEAFMANIYALYNLSVDDNIYVPPPASVEHSGKGIKRMSPA